MLMSILRLTLFGTALMFFAQLLAAEERYSSGTAQVSVVELYTSEGCSSCPPADRWLSKLKNHDELFKSVIPIAFHVDYWNYLGWRDEFSDASYSARQRQHNRVGNTGSVYTPGFVINGEEWRGFFSPLHRNSPPIDQSEASEVGELALVGAGDKYQVSFSPTKRPLKNLMVNLVYLGTDLSNEIRRGENAGRRLDHDFVVLAMTSKKLGKDGTAELPRGDVQDATAVAVWVSERGNPTPIQAVGGWLADAGNLKSSTD